MAKYLNSVILDTCLLTGLSGLISQHLLIHGGVSSTSPVKLLYISQQVETDPQSAKHYFSLANEYLKIANAQTDAKNVPLEFGYACSVINFINSKKSIIGNEQDKIEGEKLYARIKNAENDFKKRFTNNPPTDKSDDSRKASPPPPSDLPPPLSNPSTPPRGKTPPTPPPPFNAPPPPPKGVAAPSGSQAPPPPRPTTTQPAQPRVVSAKKPISNDAGGKNQNQKPALRFDDELAERLKARRSKTELQTQSKPGSFASQASSSSTSSTGKPLKDVHEGESVVHLQPPKGNSDDSTKQFNSKGEENVKRGFGKKDKDKDKKGSVEDKLNGQESPASQPPTKSKSKKSKDKPTSPRHKKDKIIALEKELADKTQQITKLEEQLTIQLKKSNSDLEENALLTAEIDELKTQLAQEKNAATELRAHLNRANGGIKMLENSILDHINKNETLSSQLETVNTNLRLLNTRKIAGPDDNHGNSLNTEISDEEQEPNAMFHMRMELNNANAVIANYQNKLIQVITPSRWRYLIDFVALLTSSGLSTLGIIVILVETGTINVTNLTALGALGEFFGLGGGIVSAAVGAPVMIGSAVDCFLTCRKRQAVERNQSGYDNVSNPQGYYDDDSDDDIPMQQLHRTDDDVPLDSVVSSDGIDLNPNPFDDEPDLLPSRAPGAAQAHSSLNQHFAQGAQTHLGIVENIKQSQQPTIHQYR